jgi:pyruvate/2-oxoglutarate dehydrogenase complex dihydrolipoamide dehydrogenase (E3) component
MSERSFDAIVLGAGPGGYVCAIRLAQLGRKVAVVEEQWLGGVCLNVGCIPSKAMISAGALVKRLGDASKMGIEVGEVRVDMEKLQAWKGSVVDRLTSGVGTLFKGNKIEVVSGRGRLVAPDRIEVTGEAGTETITAPSIVLATGSRPIEIPGFAFDEEKVLSSTGALALAEVPGRVCVIGGGYIGLEIGMMLRHLGSEVTVVEMTDTLLPGTEPQLVKVVARSAKKQKIKVHTKSKALGWEEKDGSLVVRVETPKGELEVPCDKILLTVGRRPEHGGDRPRGRRRQARRPRLRRDGRLAPNERPGGLRHRRSRRPADARAQGEQGGAHRGGGCLRPPVGPGLAVRAPPSSSPTPRWRASASPRPRPSSAGTRWRSASSRSPRTAARSP